MFHVSIDRNPIIHSILVIYSASLFKTVKRLPILYPHPAFRQNLRAAPGRPSRNFCRETPIKDVYSIQNSGETKIYKTISSRIFHIAVNLINTINNRRYNPLADNWSPCSQNVIYSAKCFRIINVICSTSI